MDESHPRSRGVQVVGVLYTVTGGALLLASLNVVAGASLLPIGVPPMAALLIALGTLLLVSGIGLLGHHAWAWYLGLLISLSGIAVIGLRLLSGNPPLLLIPPLVTDGLVTLVLLGARPETGESRSAG